MPISPNVVQPPDVSLASRSVLVGGTVQPACSLWMGDDGCGLELDLVRTWLAERMHLFVAASPQAAIQAFSQSLLPDSCAAVSGVHLNDPYPSRSPAIAIFATNRPGRWTQRDAIVLSLHWPLVPMVSVVSSLGDGRRRSGPTLSGIEEVLWHEMPGRLERWLTQAASGHAGPRGLPATARREERLLEATSGIHVEALRPTDPHRSSSMAVSVAAFHAMDLEGLVDLLKLSGRQILRQSLGRPPLDEPADLLVWNVGCVDHESLAWLGMLSANRPSLKIVLLESFPRGDSTASALRAGASAVLGVPISLESLTGTLQRLATA